MDAFVLKYGRRWNRKALDWALERLAHRGPWRPLAETPAMNLWAAGEPPFASRTQDVQLWTWRIEEPGRRRLLESAGASRPDALSSHLPEDGLAVIHDLQTDRMAIGLGHACHIPVRYVKKGGSLLVAPEMKAFSNVASHKRIRRLDRGTFLHFDPSSRSTRIDDISFEFHPLPLTSLSYEDAKREVVRLLEAGAEDLKRKYPGRLPITLSGGLDSTVTAWLAHQAGMECEAFTVWFDSGSESPPPDILGARLTSEACGFPLHELRVGPEDVEALARESVYVNETNYWRDIETGSYVLRLLREIKGRGYDSMLTGLGGDGNFAGTFYRNQLGDNFQEAMAHHRINRFMLGRLCDLWGVRPLSPMQYPPLADLTLRLPQDFLIEKLDGRFSGKRILRDLYGARIETPLTSRRKDYPFNTAGSEALYARMWGDRPEREARYARWMAELLPLPRFPRTRLPRLLDRASGNRLRR